MQAKLGTLDFNIMEFKGYNQLQQAFEFSFEKKDTISGAETVQTNQQTKEKLSLSGSFFNAAITAREELIKIAKTKKPQRFATGDGIYWGQFLIKNLSFDQQYLDAKGRPIKVGFSIGLEKYTAPAKNSLASHTPPAKVDAQTPEEIQAGMEKSRLAAKGRADERAVYAALNDAYLNIKGYEGSGDALAALDDGYLDATG